MLRQMCFVLPALALAATLTGCSNKSSVAPCKVEGIVTYKGKPLPAGTIAFYTEDGTAYGGLLSSDGTYTATDLPEGEYVITVETESVNPGAEEPTGKNAARYMKAQSGREPPSDMGAAPVKKEVYVKIPAKYANAKTSPLTVKLKGGRQVHQIELD